ncbi:terminase small subunit [Janthinobacterium sp. GB4P2]|uniref:terminase small subunit n=1 Tax=unclassified Janthinobacterium TaxID=2610881 RepID=UPI003F27093C
MALTGKKRVFADAVLAGRSNKEAAIEAGYSAATASAAGSRLVKELPVAAYIAGRKSAHAAAPGAATKLPAPSSGDEDIDPLNGAHYVDPKDFLGAAMNAPELDMRQRIDCAKALMPFEHQKLGEGGKKGEKQAAAKTAAKGKFSPAAPPKLVVSNK